MKHLNKLYNLFDLTTKKYPYRIALISDDEFITYKELENRVFKLVISLKQLIKEKNEKIGVYIERCPELIVSILAIIRLGCICVPIDKNYPDNRVKYIVSDSSIKLILIKNNLNVVVNEDLFKNCKILDIEKIKIGTGLEVLLQPSKIDLLYILYTSGSTGVPKGVMMPSEAFFNLLEWQIKEFPDENQKTTKTLQFSPISFDVSFQEIFVTLCEGNTLILIKEEQRRNPEMLLEFIIKMNINRMFLPYVALHQLAEIADTKNHFPLLLNQVITAGEQLLITPVIKRFFKETKSQLYNQYGPTETHVVTSYKLPKEVDSWSTLPPIGTAISNVKLYILNEQLEEVSKEIGELYIGGICLARGYLNNQHLTQERFINNPFGKGFIYKTGDEVELIENEQIKFIQRKDNQIKISGFRIEIGEIESVLLQNNMVKECVIDTRTDLFSQKKLVAYIVPKNISYVSDTKYLHNKLYFYLKDNLPEYMLPSNFIFIEKLPITPSGKIDRKFLSSLTIQRPYLNTKFISAKTSTEKIILASWQEILQIKNIGVNDNFFELGGSSLLVTQLYVLLQKQEFKISILSIFENPSIHLLAKYIDSSSLNKITANNQENFSNTQLRELSFRTKNIRLNSRIKLNPIEKIYE